MSQAYPSLQSPFSLAGRPLRNRLMCASLMTLMVANGRVTDRMLRYYANRARGGAALIVTEPFSVAKHQDIPLRVRAYNDENLDGIARLAGAVESQDSLPVPQPGLRPDQGPARRAQCTLLLFANTAVIVGSMPAKPSTEPRGS